MKYVVSVSGGLGSYEALRRCIELKGRENTSAVFADVGTVVESGESVSGEDPDLFRFLSDIERLLDFPISRIKNPKYVDIWDVFFDQRMMGSTMRDPCSRHQKRQLLGAWRRDHFGTVNVMMVIGLSWLEAHRVKDFQAVFGDSCWFPNCERPYKLNADIIADLERHGIKPPALYGRGFGHNNCGGFCVKMGLYQAWLLWSTDLPRWMYNERRELEFRAKVSLMAAIFRLKNQPITMEELRRLFEAGWVPRKRKDKSCVSCMLPSPEEVDSIRRSPVFSLA